MIPSLSIVSFDRTLVLVLLSRRVIYHQSIKQGYRQSEHVRRWVGMCRRQAYRFSAIEGSVGREGMLGKGSVGVEGKHTTLQA